MSIGPWQLYYEPARLEHPIYPSPARWYLWRTAGHERHSIEFREELFCEAEVVVVRDALNRCAQGEVAP